LLEAGKLSRSPIISWSIRSAINSDRLNLVGCHQQQSGAVQTIEFLLDTISHYARSDEGPPPGVPVHAGASFEKTMIDLCEAHGLAPLVLDSLVKLSLGPVLSELTVERLRANAKLIADRNNYLLEMGERIGNIMANNAIDVRFAGSFALARAFYNTPSTRRIDRIELLVHEEDWIEIRDLISREGFREPGNIPALKTSEEILHLITSIFPRVSCIITIITC